MWNVRGPKVCNEICIVIGFNQPLAKYKCLIKTEKQPTITKKPIPKPITQNREESKVSNTQGPQGECLDGSWGWDTTVSGLYLHPFLLAWPQTHYDEWDLTLKPKSQDQQGQKNTFDTTIFCYLEQLVFMVLLHLGLLTPGEMQERDTHITGGGVGDQNPHASLLNGLGFISGKALNYKFGPINLSCLTC